MIDAAFSSRGLERRYFFEVRHTMAALELVANGVGVALVDSFAVAGREVPGVALRPIDPVLGLRAHSATSKLFPTSHVALQFQNFFRENVEEHMMALPS